MGVLVKKPFHQIQNKVKDFWFSVIVHHHPETLVSPINKKVSKNHIKGWAFKPYGHPFTMLPWGAIFTNVTIPNGIYPPSVIWIQASDVVQQGIALSNPIFTRSINRRGGNMPHNQIIKGLWTWQQQFSKCDGVLDLCKFLGSNLTFGLPNPFCTFIRLSIFSEMHCSSPMLIVCPAIVTEPGVFM